MWKIVVGFILFAALGLYFLSKGADIDISGEKHGQLQAPAYVAAAVGSQARPLWVRG